MPAGGALPKDVKVHAEQVLVDVKFPMSSRLSRIRTVAYQCFRRGPCPKIECVHTSESIIFIATVGGGAPAPPWAPHVLCAHTSPAHWGSYMLCIRGVLCNVN